VGNETSRLSATEIFERVTAGARDELERPVADLAFSALAAGLAMGLSALAVAFLGDVLPPSLEAVILLGYPLGFVVVIIGRQQLFTENTLFPVALVLKERGHLGATARLWIVVLLGNVVGAIAFATLAMRTPGLAPGVREELVSLGLTAASPSVSELFWSAVFAGWLIALVAWLVTASTDTTAQLLCVVLLTYVVGLGHLAHSIAGSAEVLSAVMGGALGVGDYLRWFAAAVAGNAVGGVVIVALVNYAQVRSAHAGEQPPDDGEASRPPTTPAKRSPAPSSPGTPS
jgi:formate/nitrite transporter FocA (FNT family)